MLVVLLSLFFGRGGRMLRFADLVKEEVGRAVLLLLIFGGICAWRTDAWRTDAWRTDAGRSMLGWSMMKDLMSKIRMLIDVESIAAS